METLSLIYALHSGQLYGTERMALYTITGLGQQVAPVVLAPAGPIHAECTRLGIPSLLFHSPRHFALLLRPLLAKARRIAFFATSVVQSLTCLGWNLLYRRRIAHLHLVHGGAKERLSYGRKRWLNGLPVRFVAVSSYVAERLYANKVRPQQVSIIENFMTDEAVAAAPQHEASTGGLRKLAVISRLDPEKRVDLLLEAMEVCPELHGFTVSIFGAGADKQQLQARVAKGRLPVVLEGFHADVRGKLASADLLVHLCPVEPFGLAVLEAYAAKVPVLVPSAGGAASLVKDRVTGFHFDANDPNSLAATILSIHQLPADRIARTVSNAACLLETRFSQTAGIARYRSLMDELFA